MRRKIRRPYGLALWRRIVLVGLTGVAPLLVVSTTLVKSTYSGRLHNTGHERRGVAFLRPLLTMLDLATRDRAIVRTLSRDTSARVALAPQLEALRVREDAAMRAIAAEYESRYGASLDLTPAELREHGRPDADLSLLQSRWRVVRSAAIGASAADSASRDLLASLRSTIAYAGDHTHLVLDDDLDAYYLIDLLVAELPDVVVALDALREDAAPSTRASFVDDAAMLREHVRRATRDARTAVSEDPYFNGRSATLAGRIATASDTLAASATRLIALLDRGDAATTTQLLEAADGVQRAAMAAWLTAATETERLFAIRIDAIQRERRTHFIVIGVTLLLTIGAISLIVRGLIDAHQREEADTEAQLRLLGDQQPDAVVYQLVRHHDGATHFRYVSAGSERLHGVSAESAMRDASLLLRQILPEDRRLVADAHREALEALGPLRVTFRVRRADDAIRWIQVSAAPRLLSDDAVVWGGIGIDVTDRVEAQINASRLAAIVQSSHDAILSTDLHGIVTTWNRGAEAIFGYAASEMVGQSVLRLLPLERQDEERFILDRIRAGHDATHLETERLTKDGRAIHVSITASPIFDGSGVVVGASKVARDITERQRAEASRRESEERFRQLAEQIHEVFWMWDVVNDRALYLNPAFERVWGRTCESLYADPASYRETVHEEDRERVFAAHARHHEGGGYDETYRIVRPDGSVRWIHDRGFPVRDASGTVVRVVGTAEDITRQRQLEEQFRQSQKMEAIGQLAGGIAHDFNNILGAMILEAELVETDADLPTAVREKVTNLRSFADRAANLTRQLLLFSRRQVMQTRELDLNEVVSGLSSMLRRIIGEDVGLQLHLHARPLTTRADAGMLEQVLMNLAVNARDAMPGGGQLLIQTSELSVDDDAARLHPDATPGRYVSFTVRDTGTGIPADVLPHVFEPFFTTKEQGKGTGLGLATVFGIVRQHRGWVNVYSEPGQGTSFQVFLPATRSSAARLTPVAARPALVGGTETVLVVEDEAIVRRLTRNALSRAGYRVLEAVDGRDALRIVESADGESIALVVTDMVMPGGITGRQLAEEIALRQPDVKTIFTSGYSAEIAGRELVLHMGQNFIQKPFSVQHLLETVRRCLDDPDAVPNG